MTPRLAAVRVLSAVIVDGRNLPEALEFTRKAVPDKRDRALVQALAYGTLRWYVRLDAALKQLLNTTLKNKDNDVRIAILIGLYQILEMRIPDHAAVAETVKLAAAMKKPWSRGLINGVLRQFLRQRDSILATLDTEAASRTAHPAWLLKLLQQDWPDNWEQITQANNTTPPMTLRVNCQQHERDAYLQRLAEANIKAEPALHTEYGLTLAKPVDIEVLPDFMAGAVSVQDAAAQLAAQLLDARPGERILDACAAPGGKTAHVLERQPDIGAVTALDISPQRLARIGETLQRLGLSATCLAGDATAPDSWWDGVPFDHILLDAPCSATGVIRRHPDIKVLRRATDIDPLLITQQQILNALWPLLNPGGILLYVTCSVLKQENTQQIEKFLAEHSDAHLLDIIAEWGHPMPAGRQILPGEDGMDGFYYARIRKNA